MKLRFLSSVFIFVSAYSPLSIIFLLQDYDLDNNTLNNPTIVYSLLAVSLVSVFVVWFAVSRLKVSSPPVEIVSVSNRSGELVNYSIPYMISFFAMDLGDTNLLLSFAFLDRKSVV